MVSPTRNYLFCHFRWVTLTVLIGLALFIGRSAQADTTSSAVSLPTYDCGTEPIRFGDLAWESAAFSTYLLTTILEKGYGCQVEVVPGSSAALEVALTQNDIQVLAELWDGRTEIIEKGIKAGQVKVVGDTLEGGAEQGWYVPTYLIQGDASQGIEPVAPELKTVDQLIEYAPLFKSPTQPKQGRFYNCPTGWVCETTNTGLLNVLGLDHTYENFRAGTGAALDAAISSAYERREPILFYYWQPAGLMAKYDFTRLEQYPFDRTCWEAIVAQSDQACKTDFLVSHLRIAASEPFVQTHPLLIDFFENYSLPAATVNQAILDMAEQKLTGPQMAESFMQAHPEVWAEWVPDPVAQRLLALYHDPIDTDLAMAASFFPDWSMAKSINHYLTVLVRNTGDAFRSVSHVLLQSVLHPLERLFVSTPPWLMLAFIALLSWHATRKVQMALLFSMGFFLIGAMGLWGKLQQTLALVVVSTALSIVIGIPVGIFVARVRIIRRLVMPLLDMMQTMPSFVYLIPVLMLFGLGKVPALFATVIYAVPPLIRLTSLGIRQVDHELVEAVQSFGVTRWQMLTQLSLPLARPSIMAGINQTTMMALSMVVVASMIGAQGLGEDVLAGIQTLDIGRGLQAGIAIVILAIVIDRITQAYGKPHRERRPQTK